MDEERKGEWAEVADEGIAPVEDDSHPVTGRTAASDAPVNEEGIDREAGDRADAVVDGGPEPPAGAEPDLKDVAAAAREAEKDAAD
jgi:hypothetical protein